MFMRAGSALHCAQQHRCMFALCLLQQCSCMLVTMVQHFGSNIQKYRPLAAPTDYCKGGTFLEIRHGQVNSGCVGWYQSTSWVHR
jgi:hypothetical protein